jgi:ribosome recycling factor
VSTEMADLVLEDADEKMHKAVVHARAEFASIRTGRAAPSLVEKLPVEYYGAETPLQQIASFTVPEARQLLITPYDKTSIGAIEKALQQSDLGLNPSNDGHAIRLSFPPLTAERRKEYVKLVKNMAEEGKITLRNQRRAARSELEAMKKDSELSEDELKRYEAELDKRIHAHEADIDTAFAVKEKELLED